MTVDKKTMNAPPSSPSTKKVKTFQDSELERMMVKGEEVLLRAELHNAIYWKSYAVLAFAVLMWFAIPQFGILFGISGALMLCTAILTKHYLLLAVTNKRILARYGLLQMDVVDIRLSKIESIDLERMLTGHVFGYASVVVMGTGQRLIRVPFIRNAEEFRRFYNEMVLVEEGNDETAAELKASKEIEDAAVQQPAKAPRKKSKATK